MRIYGLGVLGFWGTHNRVVLGVVEGVMMKGMGTLRWDVGEDIRLCVEMKSGKDGWEMLFGRVVFVGVWLRSGVG